ncbi:hypothetical protein [Erwinia pyrifoliae]|uniref:Uncharacterized protein n=1 Tax=Erwinia pyrifoliae TaxID=79967 RepID=A0ABY5X4W1_ERWPY|nr:hypothetical protein [Erwinia pyrifoliae]UWS30657.1 hypothetical protein NYP81_04095 [Erwinia pyrifoliae]UWS32119.1 hypothetical protein NYP84_10600 [Erwinia pyrifoliae]UXK13670.1 hypothetical protein NYP80_07665 [Erwinia pyrifoliae]
MNKRKSKISAMAAAMAISIAPVLADSIAHHDVRIDRHSAMSMSLQDVSQSVVYLPIEEATPYLQSLADRMRFHRKNLALEWEEKQVPIELKKQKKSTRDDFVALKAHIDICSNFVEAARLALNTVPASESKLRAEIIAFARASATLRYSIESILDFMKSTHAPARSIDAALTVTAEQVHALIRSEHKSLGIDEPKFH